MCRILESNHKAALRPSANTSLLHAQHECCWSAVDKTPFSHERAFSTTDLYIILKMATKPCSNIKFGQSRRRIRRVLLA